LLITNSSKKEAVITNIPTKKAWHRNLNDLAASHKRTITIRII
jgi:hypothetical protein